MRIISKFRDYYDSAAAYGIDRTVVYVRETKEITPRKQSRWTYRPVLFKHKNITYEYQQGQIGFCGGCYPFVIVTWYEKQELKRNVFWSLEFFSEFYGKYVPGWEKGYKYRKESWTHQRFREFFEWVPEGFSEIFHTHQIPIFVRYSNEEVIANPNLRDFEFYRLFDSFQAHQELAMYVGGVLRQSENSMIQLSDEDKAAKHGFNKASFRTDPGTKPKRKRK
jgi:hypothetical protein